MTLNAIWAQSRNGAIGLGGDLPWHLPEDLAHFKAATLGAPVIMGRKTWESFPERFRPLPGRENIILTRDAAYDAPGGTVVTSLDAALSVASSFGETSWAIGGAELYAMAMPLLDQLWVTEVDVEVTGDAYAPRIGSDWAVAAQSDWQLSRTGMRFRFLRYVHAA